MVERSSKEEVLTGKSGQNTGQVLTGS